VTSPRPAVCWTRHACVGGPALTQSRRSRSHRARAISFLASSSSTAIARRPSNVATYAVVPDPENGSKTVSPTKENMRISRYGSSSGNGAGCLSFRAPGKLQMPSTYVPRSPRRSREAIFSVFVGARFGVPGFSKTRTYSKS
jgi:hypothetical protein